jgi:zinc transport system ATP-binding protein
LPLLSLEHGVIGYPGQELFRLPSFAVLAGQWVTLLGPNGSGKTTLLTSLVGILPLLRGKRVARYTRCAYVPQRFLPSRESPLTTQEFLKLQPALKRSLNADESREILLSIGVEHLLRQPLRELSIGQIQRVLMAFALLGEPEIFFLDEFLEGMDANTRPKAIAILKQAKATRGAAIVEVSHDLASVAEHADRVVLIDRKIVFDGSPRSDGFHECLHQVYGEVAHLAHHHRSLHHAA